MNNLVVFPILLPVLSGMIMFLFRDNIRLQKWISIIGLSGALVTSLFLVNANMNDGIQVLQVGGWEAPFGISLVADMLASLLVSTSSIVSLACLIYAFHSTDKQRERHYTYPLIMLLVCGVNGSFLTGDLFNLFVFFEVMLIASYVLLSLGGSKTQLRESIKYVAINIISSMLFIVAIAYLYGVVGTLNMAHLSERVAEIGQDGMITTISLMFLLVFGLKAALFLYFWLPGSYSSPPAAVSAIFAALLTKVGIYTILRMFTLVFYHHTAVTHNLMIWLAGLTMLFGAFGAVSQWNVRKILAYNVIIAVGFIVVGIGLNNAAALTGTLFYLVHDMIAKALIFILGGAMISIAGTHKLREISGLISHHPLLGWLFFLSALALAGVPPFSGFVGKLMILQGGVEKEFYAIVSISLVTSLLVLYSVMKIFIHGFWGETILSEDEEKSTGKGILIPGSILAAFIIALGLGADWALIYIDQAVEVLMNPSLYIEAVYSKS
ncbi:Na+/H+ antiporter subunit D [Xylanibacillus composti]|uniref:Na+/H+ antiporter subunit D n=1 Tax=Xylanibacillus composti TaxID=1572762 RepID=A0A8J4H570_9BACL|nr:Na+/H+ antiporter subunit D [Xylanibacillus composti]MDT9725338.1 Na+/H+ antiporter subunit D [Xylanibacillus composti]GIQ69099.1 Na+/H+ antiporter subunit D [Xylanibacillus composti]